MGVLNDGRIWILPAVHECAVLYWWCWHIMLKGWKKPSFTAILKIGLFYTYFELFQLPYQCWVRAHGFFLVLILLLQRCDVAVLQLFVVLGQVSVALSDSVIYCKRLTVLIIKQKAIVKFLISLQQICLFPLYGFPVQYLSCPSSFNLNTAITSLSKQRIWRRRPDM